jgi:hypothetical protein
LTPKLLKAALFRWVQTLAENIQGVIAVDGKTICNLGDSFHGKKASHSITAFAAENDIILGQLRTAEKSNEIIAIQELLNTLALKGCVVTIDAMGCQTAITKKFGTKKAIMLITDL